MANAHCNPARFLISALVLVVFPVPGALAEPPDVTWDLGNVSIPIHTTDPVARNWSWNCDDPSGQDPLTLRCQVLDTTLGLPGSGQEVLLEDAVCGSGSGPIFTNFTYDVTPPDLLTDHRYSYQAFCQDTISNTFFRSFWFWYDSGDPDVSIVSAPDLATTETTASFNFTCDDASYDYDFSPSSYVAACSLQCALWDADTDSPIVPAQPCDTSPVTDAATLAAHEYTGLTPRRYRFEVSGVDVVGNQSVVQSYVWEVIDAPAPIPTLPRWGLLILVALLLSGGSWIAKRRGPERASR
jgi:hypothetical protein